MWNADGPQRQRHGVTKNLVEGIGGALVGAAAVLLLRSLFKDRPGVAAATAEAASADSAGATGAVASEGAAARKPGASEKSSTPKRSSRKASPPEADQENPT
jgi:hypothetical protein